MKYEDWLAHFNPNHDPKNGRFSSSKFGTARLGNKIKKNYYKTYRETEKQYNKESAHIDSLKPIFSEKGMPFWLIEEKRRLWSKLYREQLKKDFKIKDNEYDDVLDNAPMMNRFGTPSSKEFLTSLKQPSEEKLKLLPLTYQFLKGSNNDALLNQRLRNIRSSVNHNEMMNLIQQQQIANMQMQEAQRIAIQEGNRCMSLAMTGGMNPFMFG